MTTPAGARMGRVPTDRLNLEFPRSLAVYDKYEEAQTAVDYLSDHEFAVENVLIVGTDLKQVERVTGRLTWGKVMAGGLLSGMWFGLFVGLLLSMLSQGPIWGNLAVAVAFGGVFGAVWAGLGYSLTRGTRDFTSVSQVVATRYELLVEHRVFNEAAQMLGRMPGGPAARAAAAGAAAPGGSATSGMPAGEAPARPNPYEGRYGVRTDAPPAPAAPPQAEQPTPPVQARPNPYEGKYGVKRDPQELPPPAGEPVDPSAAPPAPRD